jgi:hypothetical protein
MNQVVDYGGNREYSSNDAYNIDEESVPLVEVHHIKHSHWVCFVFKVHHGQLSQNHFV